MKKFSELFQGRSATARGMPKEIFSRKLSLGPGETSQWLVAREPTLEAMLQRRGDGLAEDESSLINNFGVYLWHVI